MLLLVELARLLLSGQSFSAFPCSRLLPFGVASRHETSRSPRSTRSSIVSHPVCDEGVILGSHCNIRSRPKLRFSAVLFCTSRHPWTILGRGRLASSISFFGGGSLLPVDPPYYLRFFLLFFSKKKKTSLSISQLPFFLDPLVNFPLARVDLYTAATAILDLFDSSELPVSRVVTLRVAFSFTRGRGRHRSCRR